MTKPTEIETALDASMRVGGLMGQLKAAKELIEALRQENAALCTRNHELHARAVAAETSLLAAESAMKVYQNL